MGGLPALERLHLSGNPLTGIPAELGNLSELRSLVIAESGLSGEIAMELGHLWKLRTLVLSGNRLSGEIPAELGDLGMLEELDLSENRLTGEIPAELGYLSNLRILVLSGNRLTGEVPADLGYLSELEELWLLGNELSGCLPDLGGVVTDAHHLILPTEAPGIEVVGRTSSTAELRIAVQNADGAVLYRSDDGESGTYQLVASDVVTDGFVDRGLNPNTTYYYRAQAFNGCGRSDLAEGAVGVITEADGPVDVPPTPTGIAGLKFDVRMGSDDGGCAWQESPGATFYQVFQGSNLDAEVSAPRTDYRDYSPNTFLGGFSETTYKVRACNKAGCSDFTETVTVS